MDLYDTTMGLKKDCNRMKQTLNQIIAELKKRNDMVRLKTEKPSTSHSKLTSSVKPMDFRRYDDHGDSISLPNGNNFPVVNAQSVKKELVQPEEQAAIKTFTTFIPVK